MPGWKAADLWRRFTCSEREELGDSLATTFVREVCLLLKRYESGERTSKAGDHINLKNLQWAMPPEIATVLNATFSIDTERFASPLNVVAADTLTYYSCYKQDEVFGACHDAYSRQWRGASVAHPTYEPAAMDKALHWSISSATGSSAPVCTVLVMPTGRVSHIGGGTNAHPLVQHIAQGDPHSTA